MAENTVHWCTLDLPPPVNQLKPTNQQTRTERTTQTQAVCCSDDNTHLVKRRPKEVQVRVDPDMLAHRQNWIVDQPTDCVMRNSWVHLGCPAPSGFELCLESLYTYMFWVFEHVTKCTRIWKQKEVLNVQIIFIVGRVELTFRQLRANRESIRLAGGMRRKALVLLHFNWEL